MMAGKGGKKKPGPPRLNLFGKVAALHKSLFHSKPLPPPAPKKESPEIVPEMQGLVEYSLLENYPVPKQIDENLYLTRVIDKVIWERTEINQRSNLAKLQELRLLERENELRREQTRLEEEYLEHTARVHEKLSFYLNQYAIVLLIALVCVAGGVAIGVNLPESVKCHSPHSLCWHVRVRPKSIGK
jgi:hypothetical protein